MYVCFFLQLFHFEFSLFGAKEKKLDLSTMRTETICEEDIEPSCPQDMDDSSGNKVSISERAKACEEFLNELRQLDSEGDKEFESSLLKEKSTRGKLRNCNELFLYNFIFQ